jgi:hypothetical protein
MIRTGSKVRRDGGMSDVAGVAVEGVDADELSSALLKMRARTF